MESNFLLYTLTQIILIYLSKKTFYNLEFVKVSYHKPVADNEEIQTLVHSTSSRIKKIKFSFIFLNTFA